MPPEPALEIVGFGEAMVLFQPEGGEALETARRLAVHVAGAELNLCAAAARLGVRSGMCSRIGSDPMGARVLAEAGRLGVDVGLVATDADHPTGVFFKEVRPDGARRVHYYRRGSAASTMDGSDADRLLAARPAMVAVSGITAALGPGPRDAVRRLLSGARAAGIAVAFDPNLRPALGPLPEQAAGLRDLLCLVDYLVIGLDEAEPLFGTVDPEAVFVAATSAGVREIVLKAGADGCYHGSVGSVLHLPSAATVVVDPVGAGDAFAGGYLAARLRGAGLAGAAWLGSQLAAAVVGAEGDNHGLPDTAAAAELLRRALADPYKNDPAT